MRGVIKWCSNFQQNRLETSIVTEDLLLPCHFIVGRRLAPPFPPLHLAILPTLVGPSFTRRLGAATLRLCPQRAIDVTLHSVALDLEQPHWSSRKVQS